jgi:Flp pilus assembly protein TadG
MIHIHNRSSSNRRSIRGTARRAGTVTLEMAISLTLLFNICFGVVEFGYYYFIKNTLENCAREGCRAAIAAGATENSVTNAVITQLEAANLISSGSTSTTPYTVVTSPTNIATGSIGTTITCTVSGTWGTVGAGFRPLAIISTSKVVSGSCAMRKEG